MPDLFDQYAVHYRWEMFRWRYAPADFRRHKRHSTGGFVDLVTRRGLQNKPVLDCSCGLGFKTIVLREAGLDVAGSDGCAAAVEYAREVTRAEGHPEIALFHASWADLPRQAPPRYAAIFNDALSWVDSERAMSEALHGLHEALTPGGLLAYMGAPPGSGEEEHQKVLKEEWERVVQGGKHRLGFRVRGAGTTVTELLTYEKGDEYIDEHRLYVVDEAGAGKPRLETAALRHSLHWSWARMEAQLRKAGFVSFFTQLFVAGNGREFPLVVAVRDSW